MIDTITNSYELCIGTMFSDYTCMSPWDKPVLIALNLIIMLFVVDGFMFTINIVTLDKNIYGCFNYFANRK